MNTLGFQKKKGFYSPINSVQVMSNRSVNLLKLFPEQTYSKRLISSSTCVHTFASNWQLPFLNQLKQENYRRNDLLYEAGLKFEWTTQTRYRLRYGAWQFIHSRTSKYKEWIHVQRKLSMVTATPPREDFVQVVNSEQDLLKRTSPTTPTSTPPPPPHPPPPFPSPDSKFLRVDTLSDGAWSAWTQLLTCKGDKYG